MMSTKSLVGAKVMYCGHDGWFVADIFRIRDAIVVRANDEVNADNLVRGRNGEATHHLSDFPGPVFWRPKLGVFVVPHVNLKEIKR